MPESRIGRGLLSDLKVGVSGSPRHERLAFPLLIVCIALLERTLFSLAFWNRFGDHAINHIEHWFYVGVAQGVFYPNHHPLDVTFYLLRPPGILFGEWSFYAVAALSAMLSCLAGVLLYHLVSLLADRKTGLAAGVIYVGLLEPLTLSTVSFTHDLVQIPVIIACLYSFVRAKKANTNGEARIWAACFFLLVLLGWHVNPVILVAPLAAGLALLADWTTRPGMPHGYAPAWMVAGAAVVFLLVSGGLSAGLDAFLAKTGYGLSFAAPHQERYPARDVAALSWDEFMARGNVAAFLGLLGAGIALRRRDSLTLALLAVGVLAASQLNRGMRVLDVGLAIAAAYLLREALRGRSVPSKTPWVLGAGIAIVTLFTGLPLPYRGVVALGLAGIIVACRMQDRDSGRFWSLLALILFVNAGLFGLDLAYNAPEKRSSHLEYEVLRSLDESGATGTILASWDRGYFIEAVSGLKAASRVERIDVSVHNMLWLPPHLAAARLAAAGVDYVLFADQDFGVTPNEGGAQIILKRGLVFRPEVAVGAHLLPYTTIYRLWEDSVDEEVFHKIEERTGDELAVRAYQIHADPAADIALPQRFVGSLVENIGKARSIRVAYHAEGLSVGNPLDVKTVWFEDNETRDVVLYIPPQVESSRDGRVTITPEGDEEWGFWATHRYRNRGADLTANLSFDVCRMELPCESKIVGERFSSGQTRVVRFFTALQSPDEAVVVRETTDEATARNLELLSTAYAYEGGRLLTTYQ